MKSKINFFLILCLFSTFCFATEEREITVENIHNSIRGIMQTAAVTGAVTEDEQRKIKKALKDASILISRSEASLDKTQFCNKLDAACLYQDVGDLLDQCKIRWLDVDGFSSRLTQAVLYQLSHPLLESVIDFFTKNPDASSLFEIYRRLYAYGELSTNKEVKKHARAKMIAYARTEQQMAIVEMEEIDKQPVNFTKRDPSKFGRRTAALMKKNYEEERKRVADISLSVLGSDIDSIVFTAETSLFRFQEVLRYPEHITIEGWSTLLLDYFDFLKKLSPTGESFERTEEFSEVFKKLEGRRDHVSQLSQQLLIIFMMTDEWERSLALLNAIPDTKDISTQRHLNHLKIYMHYMFDGNQEPLIALLDEKKSQKGKKHKKLVEEARKAAEAAKARETEAPVPLEKTGATKPKQVDPGTESAGGAPGKKLKKKGHSAATGPETDTKPERPKSTEASEGAAGAGAGAGAGAAVDETQTIRATALKSRSRTVDEAILLGKFDFTREEFLTYITHLGCTIRETSGSHTVINLPDDTFGLFLFNGEGAILTLPMWRDQVPYYLRKQIKEFREKLVR
jgi:hypothetical protein